VPSRLALFVLRPDRPNLACLSGNLLCKKDSPLHSGVTLGVASGTLFLSLPNVIHPPTLLRMISLQTICACGDGKSPAWSDIYDAGVDVVVFSRFDGEN
jgi:hypothetical protein